MQLPARALGAMSPARPRGGRACLPVVDTLTAASHGTPAALDSLSDTLSSKPWQAWQASHSGSLGPTPYNIQCGSFTLPRHWLHLLTSNQAQHLSALAPMALLLLLSVPNSSFGSY